jgi:hypothetical protein
MTTPPIFGLFVFLSANFGLMAQSTLEDILLPKRSPAELSSKEANDAWRRVVEMFRANDLANAKQEGDKFLSSNFNASALQVLGVKVMVSLAGGAAMGTTFENREDQEAYKQLQTDRANITRRYNELQKIIQTNEATINQVTVNKSIPVPMGSSNYFKCLNCQNKIKAAMKDLEDLKKPIAATKEKITALQTKAARSLQPITLQLLDQLIIAEEIEAAVAIANTYIRVIGNDVAVALKQQDIKRIEDVYVKVAEVLKLLGSEIEAMVNINRTYWEARDRTSAFLAKVAVMSPDKDLERILQMRVATDDTQLKIQRNMMLGQRNYELVCAQAELDTDLATKELQSFKRLYPDHPQLRELELYVITNKVRSAEQVLDKAESDFADLKKRFNPAKLRMTLNQSSNGVNVSSGVITDKRATRKSSEDILVEMGIAPADAKMVQISLGGLHARLAVLDKMKLPPERKSRLDALKTESNALLVTIQE